MNKRNVRNEKNKFFSSPCLDGMHELKVHLRIEPTVNDCGHELNDAKSLVAVGKIIGTALKMGWKVMSRPIADDEVTLYHRD
jgi:hypothetical protein